MNQATHNVMVVDDDESIRNSLRKLLSSEGYHVTLAANGVEAMETFRRQQEQIDLLLIDLNMPLKNGWATLDRLLEANCSPPVFILTGLSHQSELAEAAGVCALVEKPINVPGLLRLIQRQLAGPLPSPQAAGHRVFPFYCLRARNESAGQEPEPTVPTYNHWGLNE